MAAALPLSSPKSKNYLTFSVAYRGVLEQYNNSPRKTSYCKGQCVAGVAPELFLRAAEEERKSLGPEDAKSEEGFPEGVGTPTSTRAAGGRPSAAACAKGGSGLAKCRFRRNWYRFRIRPGCVGMRRDFEFQQISSFVD